MIFLKASSSLSGPYDDIQTPAGVELLDYEVEIGVVLRRDVSAAESITDANVGDFIAGVTLCNDVSARDVMFGAGFMQWYRGKSYRGFCPTGPLLYLLARSEVAAALTSLTITLDLNGERRQTGSSAQFIHKPGDTVAELSSLMDLRRGDMILTGTPGGVIAQGSPAIMGILREHLLNDAARREQFTAEMQKSAKFLQPGDVLNLSIRDEGAGIDLGGQESRIC
ncbi:MULTISPECIES: fumarylacetoacetate hydrolase family protein [unclassified Sphingobium]|uniref:fumarylacetoacetate hydrolase family protein n=1 Tax=unclassified Sphingobium TaxID=2611147 RepID=UPI00214AAA8D|nr:MULTISPECIES: fumarylacetoacetate hydrolase family protein [unclassified Sphingobium]